jgi:hypothetical protein
MNGSNDTAYKVGGGMTMLTGEFLVATQLRAA